MRICIDIDGVIAELRKPGQTYAQVAPVPGSLERLRQLKDAGHYIILYTARHSKTCAGNVGMIIARQGLITLQWLERHGVAFDEIHFGKPHADIYIDDNAMRFQTWDAIAPDGSSLLASSESRLAGESKP